MVRYLSIYHLILMTSVRIRIAIVFVMYAIFCNGCLKGAVQQ